MGFADDLQRLCLNAKDKTEQVVRRTALELQSSMVEMSPVGNPDGWAANKGSIYQRETHNLFVDALNADAAITGAARTQRMGQKTLKETYKLKAGKGYVGGRFKSNWQVGLGYFNTDTSAPPNASGGDVLGRTQAVLNGWKPGTDICLSNSLPYSRKLEYGHSKQAPGGMVRITVQAYSDAVKKAVASVKG